MTAAPCAATSLAEELHPKPEPSEDSLMVQDYPSIRDSDPLMDQRQWDLIQTLSESLATSESELKRAEDTPTIINPPADAVAATICLMVEDPYFDGPASPPAAPGTADSTEWPEEWTVNKAFNPPAICLQDQSLEAPASGEARQSGSVWKSLDEITSTWLLRSW